MSPPISARSNKTARISRWLHAHALWCAAAAGIFVAGLAAIAGAALFIGFGLYDVSASTPHPNLVAWTVHTTMIRSVQMHAQRIKSPAHFTQAQALAGFHEYENDCVPCHGGPGVPRAAWVRGLNPTPPFLIDAARRWTPSELRLIVGNGIKMTAMPAWKFTHSDSQLWDLVAFLEEMPDLTPRQYAKMRAAERHAS